MNRTKLSLALAGIVAVAMHAPAWSEPTQEPDRETKKLDEMQPFRGKVTAIDLAQKTLSVEAKLIHITADTKLSKEREEIKMSDIKVGDEVDGMARLGFNGNTEAITVKVVPKERNTELRGRSWAASAPMLAALAY